MKFTPTIHTQAEVASLRAERGHSGIPSQLWVCGELQSLAAPTVAIVGTRSPSVMGRRLAFRFAAELSRNGICVISGLALGIDAAAHAGAVSVGGVTIGILAGGHDKFFPPLNRELAERMIEAGGAVISPFAPHEPAYPSRFLARNGLIVALADAVVIVEAPERSGAINTASWAAEANIPVLVVPGDVDRPKVAGCLNLIRDGATLIRNIDDVLEALRLPLRRRKSYNDAPTLFDIERRSELPNPLSTDPRVQTLLVRLQDEPQTIDNLLVQTGLPIGRLIPLLTLLQHAQLVIEYENGYFGTNRHAMH